MVLEESVLETCRRRGVSRRRFMQFCGTMAATIAGSRNVQDHVIHFYHLHALDWVDVTLALKADPAKTSQLAQSISEWPKSSTTYFKGVQDRVKALVASRQLSLFSSGDWGHPAYQLPPEANLLAVAHYIEALDMQRDFIRIHAVLGGKSLTRRLKSRVRSTAKRGNQSDAISIGAHDAFQRAGGSVQPLREAGLHPRCPRRRQLP